jgi:hypothetical protein
MAAHGDWDLIVADHYSVTAFPIVNIQRNTKGTPHIILGTSPMVNLIASYLSQGKNFNNREFPQ